MRGLRRQLRRWRQEVGGYWARLRTFHRTALGMFIAIALVWGARETLLDPMAGELREMNEALADAGAPAVVPVPEEDNDVLELRELVENLERTLAEAKAREAEAVAEARPLRPEEKGLAVTETGALIAEAGLRVKRLEERSPAPSGTASPQDAAPKKGAAGEAEASAPETRPAEGPLPQSVHDYSVYGTFDGIQRFLEAMDEYPWPSRLTALSITVPEEGVAGTRQNTLDPAIELTFQQVLYYYDDRD